MRVAQRVHAVSARLSAIVHATEDAEKVIQALHNICPPPFQSRTELKRFKGHYGNEILTISTSLRGRSAELFFHNLWALLPLPDREEVLRDLDSRLDEEGRLHLRLDKQGCLLQEFRLRDQDPIRIQLAFQAKAVSRLESHDRTRTVFESLQDSA